MTRLFRLLAFVAALTLGVAPFAYAAEVDTITVKDASNVTREVPTLLSVEAYIDQLEGYVDGIGNTNDSACGSDTGDCSQIALTKRNNQRLTTLIGSLGGTGTIGSDFPASATASGIAAGAGSVTGTPGLKQLIGCDSSVAISTASSGNTELVALTSGMAVYVCGYMVVGDGDVDVQFIYGTGTACATGETDLTGAMPIASSGGGMAESSSFWRGMKSAASNALCIELSAAVQVSGILYYTKF